MKNRKRLLSIVLTLCIILTMMPMTVNAASTVNHIELIEIGRASCRERV